MIHLSVNNKNSKEAWNTIYNTDIGNHAWGGTWAVLDKILEDCIEIFDYGCGMAYYMSHLKNLGKIVNGFERSIVAIKHIRRRDSELFVYNYLPDKCYEAVLCMEVLEHLDSPDELMRLLIKKAKRKLILTVPNNGGGKYHVNLFTEKDFSTIFCDYSVKQTVIHPPWGGDKRIVEVVKCK